MSARIPELQQASPKIRKSKSTRKRMWVLIGVHVLFIIHLIHWWAAGSTLAPLEPSEGMDLAKHGVLNAGGLFFLLMILTSMIFGRFFCGWGCHMVALQDWCAHLLKKIGIQPKMFRTRTLVWVSYWAGFYFFLWPLVYRWGIEGILKESWPKAWKFMGQSQPFHGIQLELVREGFWNTFPTDVVIIVFMLFVCGFLVVYFLGSKAFCNYGCPYGAFMGPADLLSPGKILADLDKCHSCGHCTATCTSNVNVHKEIQAYKKVVDIKCFKCLDCVSVCPNGALSFGFATPTIFSSVSPGKNKPKKNYDTTIPEEGVLWIVGILTFLSLRGAYGSIPLLLALGLCGCFVAMTWIAMNCLRKKRVSFNRILLKTTGKFTMHGKLYLALFVLVLASIVYTGELTLQLTLAEHANNRLPYDTRAAFAPNFKIKEEHKEDLELAISGYESNIGWLYGGRAILHTPQIFSRLAGLYLFKRDFSKAEDYTRRSLAIHGENDAQLSALAQIVMLQRRPQEARAMLEDILKRNPEYTLCRFNAYSLLAAMKEYKEAEKHAKAYLAVLPEDTGFRSQFAINFLLPLGRTAEALSEIQTAINYAPNNPDLLLRMAGVTMISGDVQGAIEQLLALEVLQPNAAVVARSLSEAYQLKGDFLEAQKWAIQASKRVQTAPGGHSFPHK